MSNKEKYYKQCLLRRPIVKCGSGDPDAMIIQPLDGSQAYEKMVSWIPEKHAVVGKYLKLKSRKDTWSDGWEVIYAGPRRPADYVEPRSRDYIHQRKVSDRIKEKKNNG